MTKKPLPYTLAIGQTIHVDGHLVWAGTRNRTVQVGETVRSEDGYYAVRWTGDEFVVVARTSAP